jgi:hypothetical protein
MKKLKFIHLLIALLTITAFSLIPNLFGLEEFFKTHGITYLTILVQAILISFVLGFGFLLHPFDEKNISINIRNKFLGIAFLLDCIFLLICFTVVDDKCELMVPLKCIHLTLLLSYWGLYAFSDYYYCNIKVN